jgi:Uma2 family endonuclease
MRWNMKTLHTLRNNPEESPYIGIGNGEEDIVSEDGRYVSEEEYWEKYYSHPDFSYEWNNGYLEEKPMTDYRGSQAYQWFIFLLRQFLEEFPIAKMIGLEFGFRLALPHKTSIRKPDLGVVVSSNPIILGDTDFSYKGTFDLCIESLSYSKQKEIIRDTVEKKKEYQGAGVKEYYILDARKEETAFYRLNPKGRYQKIRPIKKDIIQSQVLPGFRFRISDIYRQPSLEEMADDGIYSSFVLPFHQKVRQIAEQERRRAEQAEQRAALLADKLKELGIVI